jgi:CRP/FNR family transcriptional regulator, cyclic AMP receptor protein
VIEVTEAFYASGCLPNGLISFSEGSINHILLQNVLWPIHNQLQSSKNFQPGEDANFVFFVQEGSVKLTTHECGAENLLGKALQGQFFGEACLHDVPVRLATATAIGRCRITAVTKAAMLFTIRSQPRFAGMFIDYLADQNSWTQKHLLEHLLAQAEAA